MIRKPVPILVTGVPRSGTTWLARALANAPGTALAGREPMNPRANQYALGGSLSGWTRLTSLTAAQRRSLRAAYRGLNPLVYSRFGHRQLLAPLPGIRVIVKDPFAMLSLPTIVSATGAVPVLLYRHPGAVLASYRRMGWHADLDEVAAVIPDAAWPLETTHERDVTSVDSDVEAVAMAYFWVALNARALDDLELTSGGVVVAHEEATLGGVPALRELYARLGLPWTDRLERSLHDPTKTQEPKPTRPKGLHDFDRSPETVATSWRSHITSSELAAMEQIAGPTLHALSVRRLVLGLADGRHQP